MLDFGEVFGGVCGLTSALVELAKRGVGNQHFGLGDALRDTLFPENNAMMTLVSRRNLPAIRFDFFAAFLNGLGYRVQIPLFNSPNELQQFATGCSIRHTQPPREVEHLALLWRSQAANLLNDLVL